MLSYDISTALSIYSTYYGIGNLDAITSTIVGGENGGENGSITTTYVTHLTVFTAVTTVGDPNSQTVAASTTDSKTSDSKYLVMLLGCWLHYIHIL